MYVCAWCSYCWAFALLTVLVLYVVLQYSIMIADWRDSTSRVLCSRSTIKHSTVQYSTVQHSTVQYNTAQQCHFQERSLSPKVKGKMTITSDSYCINRANDHCVIGGRGLCKLGSSYNVRSRTARVQHDPTQAAGRSRCSSTVDNNTKGMAWLFWYCLWYCRQGLTKPTPLPTGFHTTMALSSTYASTYICIVVLTLKQSLTPTLPSTSTSTRVSTSTQMPASIHQYNTLRKKTSTLPLTHPHYR